MLAYLDIVSEIIHSSMSVEKDTRTGIRTRSISGVQFEHDMRKGFPLLTTKWVTPPKEPPEFILTKSSASS